MAPAIKEGPAGEPWVPPRAPSLRASGGPSRSDESAVSPEPLR